MIKIIQIASASDGEVSRFESTLYGLSDEGNIYFWGRKKKIRDDGSDTGEYIFGWIEMIDEINIT
jgi:hypothetical protein